MSEPSSAEAVREKMLSESGGRCCMCAAHIGLQVEVVPIMPLSEGGEYSPNNLAVLCAFCRWLVQRQKVTAAALKNYKKQWVSQVAKAPKLYREQGLTIHGHPLRLEATHKGVETILEGSELSTLLANFFNCLDTFLIHEDQHLENAASLAVIRAFRDMYNYVPPEQDIKEQTTADSRKLDLLYRGIRTLFSVGLGGSKPKAAKTPAPAAPRKVAAKKPVAKKKPAAKPAGRKHAPKPASLKKKVAARKPAKKARRK
ncbi:MAG: HNH endonuclease [Phycisphaerae bacterium]|nr:HNH endonuclease [Phycisphaerae bacterium]